LPSDVAYGSCLRENSEIEFANGNFVSTSINLKNKSAGDGCRDKTIEKTILRAFRARTFSRSQGQSRPGRAGNKSDHVRYEADSIRRFTVARGVRYAAPVVTNDPIEDHPALGEPFERPDLIGAHEAAVARHVRREDGYELAADLAKV
jgi:hypothetical protein